MASNITFSPKEWQIAIIGESTAGDAATASLVALDVDSISMPNLNVTQVLDVRGGGSGRTFKNADFYQDNILRATEITVSGRFHDDSAHLGLLKNIGGDTSGDPSIPTGYSPDAIAYGDSKTASHFDTFTLYCAAPEVSNAKHILMPGCVVTNFVLSADAGSEGGLYKYTATISTGKKPTLNSTENLTSDITNYAASTVFKLSSATATQVADADVALQSFSLTIDNPAVFTGVSSTGYQVVNRGAECAVTVDCQVKYDDNTDTFIHDFDNQGSTVMSADAFLITASNAGGIEIDNGVFTNVALVEGDIMMLDISIKATDDGTDEVVAFDF
tara:strand:+ start:2988 stop:3977 length:990 start_codon:yes stop_codon:yes gene_type:complete